MMFSKKGSVIYRTTCPPLFLKYIENIDHKSLAVLTTMALIVDQASYENLDGFLEIDEFLKYFILFSFGKEFHHTQKSLKYK